MRLVAAAYAKLVDVIRFLREADEEFLAGEDHNTMNEEGDRCLDKNF